MQTEIHGSVIAGAASKGLDVEGLERELSAIWAEMTREKEGEHVSVVRACVLNLILFTPRPDERSQMDALLSEVTEQHPCRAFVILADRDASAARLDAYVSTRCQLSTRGAKQICGEQLTIEAAGEFVERVASAVTPLLVPDVPVFLWWREIPKQGDRHFERLAKLSDRVVFDVAASVRPQTDLLRLARLLAAHDAEMRATDLDWGRLTSWRNIVAHFWDVESYRPYLGRIDRVVVDYDPPASAPGEISAQAWLITGWLASRLKWELDEESPRVAEGVTSFRMRAGERVIQIELRAIDDVAGCERRISSLTLAADEGEAEFRVSWRPERTKLETSVRVGGEQAVSHVLAYEARTDGARLSNELAILARDKVYEESLAAAAKLIGSLAS